ncbi:MAG: LysR family transcriptional regulator [Firmicutes bacterium HGW-Firmicutes-16]|nr:MAG: LysR family transcriptional regulator [Firmicutes bacterium HGW-Firmicutes-16]
MTLRNLRIFLAVAETGSMSKAAKALYMTQPSISQDISEMERTYKVILFERKNHFLKLTPTGELLMQYAKKTLDAAKETEDFLNYESSHPRIRVGATATIGACIMSPIVVKLHEAIPGIVHHVCVANTVIIVGKILKGELDIALVEGIVSDPNLEVRDVIRDKLVLICAQEHTFCTRDSIDIHELDRIPLILSEIGSGTRSRFEDLLRQNDIEENMCWGSYNFDAIIDAVKHNLGVSIISERIAKKSSIKDTLHVCEITGADMNCNYQLVYPKNKIFPISLTEFIRICEEMSLYDIL